MPRTKYKDNFEFKCSQVAFIGHLLTSEGLKPYPRKVEAICNMPRPEYVQGVQRFVNTDKCLSKFLEDLSDISEQTHSQRSPLGAVSRARRSL